MNAILAHIAGVPVEETLAMAMPVIGVTCAAVIARFRARPKRARRRS